MSSLARADALRALYALSQRLEEDFTQWIRREGGRAPKTAKSIAKLAIGIARRMRDDVERLESDLLSGKAVSGDSLVGLAFRARSVERLHDALDHSTYHSIHPVLSPTVTIETDALSITGSVLVCGTRDASYEVMTMTEQKVENLCDAEWRAEVEWPLRIFRIPHPPLDWPLHHVLLYHEIGHAAFAGFKFVPPPELDPKRGKDLMERIRIADEQNYYIDCMQNWVEELFADAVGVLLAGPAYALAFGRFLGGFFPLDAASTTHPPTALRIELIDTLLQQQGYAARLPKPGLTLASDWLVEATSVTNYRTNDTRLRSVLKYVVRDVKQHHAALVTEALKAVGARRYDAKYLDDDDQRGDWMYTHDIPPIEVDVTSSDTVALEPARVFSAAWMAYLKALASGGSPDDLSADSHRLAEILLGSLDGAYAIKAWTRASS